MPVPHQSVYLCPGINIGSSDCLMRLSPQVEILTDPADFYQFLVEGCGRAKRRITLSSLYLGNGKKSLNLVCAARFECTYCQLHLISHSYSYS